MDRVKTVAMYLPQFHRTKENDKWWGEGFTEWTAVKAAKSLFKGHAQPRIPLGGNYYDLTERKALEWQAGLMHRYGVDALCFYHYWFGHGRKLLERPAENLLHWEDIQLPFCFCWATGTWARTWSNSGNWSWSPAFDKKMVDDSAEVRERDGILVEQYFGGRDDWERHIEYLIPFFKDSRYIKLDSKPVFVLYGSDSIYCLEEMLECWREKIKQAGLAGLYVIATETKMSVPYLDANLRLRNGGRSALQGLAYNEGSSRLWRVDYDRLWQEYLAEKKLPGQRTYYCMTVDYDDTPRRGEDGLIYTGGSPDKFAKYYKAMLQQSLAEGNRLIFINAWNEWGEGMYLEPDTLHGYGYLEALYQVNNEAITWKTEGVEEWKSGQLSWEEYAKREADRAFKSKREYRLFHQWLRNIEAGKRLDSFFLKRNYNKIAVYGMGYKEEHLQAALKGTGVKILYGIDRQAGAVTGSLPVYGLHEDMPPVDAVVVTVVTEFSHIYKELCTKINCPIISLEEIVYER